MLTVVRVAWLVLPLAEGPALAGALDGRSTPVVVVAAIGAWLVWGAGVVAVLVPRSGGLTFLRIAGPATLALAVWTVVDGGEDVGPAQVVAVVAGALVAALVLFVPTVTDALVDGSSYGDERRFALRVPVTLLFGPAPLAWAVTVAGVSGGPLLLAAGEWITGAVALAAGIVAARAAVGALHQLSRRWLVFVPAGVVLHDPLALSDPVLFPRTRVRVIEPARAGAEAGATDLTQRAPGLVLVLTLSTPTTLGLRAGRSSARSLDVERVLFVPARPGAVLAEATRRRFQVAMPPPSTSSPS